MNFLSLPCPSQEDMKLWIKHIQENISGEAAGKDASPGKKTDKGKGGSGIFGKRRSKNLDKEKEEKK